MDRRFLQMGRLLQITSNTLMARGCLFWCLPFYSHVFAFFVLVSVLNKVMFFSSRARSLRSRSRFSGFLLGVPLPFLFAATAVAEHLPQIH